MPPGRTGGGGPFRDDSDGDGEHPMVELVHGSLMVYGGLMTLIHPKWWLTNT